MQDQKKSNRSVTYSAVLMAFGTFASRLLGLARESLFAALFPRWITDAWYVAFKLPNIFRRLFGEGSLSVSFIPIFVEAQNSDQNSGRSQKLVSGFFLIFSVVLLIITLLGTIFMESWLKLFLDPIYINQSEKFEMTLQMARIMFSYIYLVCVYAFIMAVLNGVGQFGRAALAPAFFNLVIIASTLIPHKYLNWPGQAIAWGVIIGGLVQLGFLVPPLYRSGYLPKIEWHWSHDIKRIFINMLPGLAGMGLLQVMTLVNVWFASQLKSGVISYITLADRVLELPLSLISVSIGVALLPTLSRVWLSGDKSHFGQVSSYYLKLNLFLSLPCAVGLYALSHPIVELLFQRGQFSAVETATTASILRLYSVLVVASSLVRVFVPAFYAIKNTWYPALVSGVCLVFHVLITPVLMTHFALSGLITATVVSSCLNFSLLVVGYRILIGSYPWYSVIRSLTRFLIPAVLMLFVVQVYSPLRQTFGDHFFAKLGSLGVAIGVSALTYLAIAYVMKLPEIRDITAKVSRKFASRGKN